MDLKSDHPYFLMKNGLIRSYPSVAKNISTQIVIMGAGITGALLAWHLCNKGFEVVVVDRRHVGTGSTCASTSLLQYEIDVPLHKLCRMRGEQDAVRSYQLCLEAIYDIRKICEQLDDNVSFETRSSLQFASYRSHVKRLKTEYHQRRQHDFRVEWMDSNEVEQKFGMKVPAALYSADAATVDAYAFTHALLRQCVQKGASVFDNSYIKKIDYPKNDTVELTTADGYILQCKELIIACGYESQQYLPKKVEKVNSTYAIVSEMQLQREFWYNDALIWETANPYLYLRTTSDNRILVGGMDDSFYNAEKRDRRIPRKTSKLEKAFYQLMPSIPFKTDFAWAGAFTSTKDGLPYIGTVTKRPHTWFALGFGGNGITFSQLAARLITEKLSGINNKDLSIFSFDRS